MHLLLLSYLPIGFNHMTQFMQFVKFLTNDLQTPHLTCALDLGTTNPRTYLRLRLVLARHWPNSSLDHPNRVLHQAANTTPIKLKAACPSPNTTATFDLLEQSEQPQYCPFKGCSQHHTRPKAPGWLDKGKTLARHLRDIHAHEISDIPPSITRKLKLFACNLYM